MSQTSSDRPRVSILIPNYNNGRAASRSGQRDFIRDLLESLERTLAEETTPFEVLVFDDGSTDDSIGTLREWATGKRWPDGRPLLTLMEGPHCGVLSITANKLSRAARGDILARLDGDIVILTPKWVTKLAAVFDAGPPRLGVVGPKQLNTAGRIHEFGDWILHPKGYHHNAHALERFAVKRSAEVDIVMGCFHCCRKAVFEELGGYDEGFLRGQTVDFDLRSRLAGWTTWAVPNIEYIHAHGERFNRSTTADSVGGIAVGLDTFRAKWGFDRLAPDLDFVKEKFAGTPLLWNPRFFGPAGAGVGAGAESAAGEGAADETPGIAIEATAWGKYANDEAFRARHDFRARVVMDVVKQVGARKTIVHLGCGAGLLAHVLAQQGLSVVGVDANRVMVTLAATVTGKQEYAKARPKFVVQEDARRTPIVDGAADMVVIIDQMEVHPNPVALLAEARRVLAVNGVLLIVARRAKTTLESSMDVDHRYTLPELVNQVMAAGGFKLAFDPRQDDSKREIIFVAVRQGSAGAVATVAGESKSARPRAVAAAAPAGAR